MSDLCNTHSLCPCFDISSGAAQKCNSIAKRRHLGLVTSGQRGGQQGQQTIVSAVTAWIPL